MKEPHYNVYFQQSGKLVKIGVTNVDNHKDAIEAVQDAYPFACPVLAVIPN